MAKLLLAKITNNLQKFLQKHITNIFIYMLFVIHNYSGLFEPRFVQLLHMIQPDGPNNPNHSFLLKPVSILHSKHIKFR